MLHRDILAKWQWQPYEETPELGPQCVGWVKKYCEERGYPISYFGGSAINGWNTGSPFDDSWVRLTYKPGMSPRQGDIVFWSEARCLNGHVSVANKHCNAKWLRHTDQNGTGNADPIQPRFSDYKNVLGWFSKLGQK